MDEYVNLRQCENCGKILPKDAIFCGNCGCKREVIQVVSVEKKSKKTFLVLIIMFLIIVVLLGCILAVLIDNGDDDNNYSMRRESTTKTTIATTKTTVATTSKEKYAEEQIVGIWAAVEFYEYGEDIEDIEDMGISAIFYADHTGKIRVDNEYMYFKWEYLQTDESQISFVLTDYTGARTIASICIDETATYTYGKLLILLSDDSTGLSDSAGLFFER